MTLKCLASSLIHFRLSRILSGLSRFPLDKIFQNLSEVYSERLLSRFAENGLNVTEFSFAISSRTDVNLSGRNAEKNNSNVDTASLYRTAKTFLQTVGEA